MVIYSLSEWDSLYNRLGYNYNRSFKMYSLIVFCINLIMFVVVILF